MRCCNITSTWFTKLILSIVIIFPGRSLTYPSSLQEESLLNSDYKQIADTRSTEQSRDDSNFFSSPGESSGGEGAILSVQTATTRSNDDGLFSSPHLNRREPFLISLKHFLLDQIRGEGRSDNEIPWHKRLGRIILSVIQYGVDKLQARYGNRTSDLPQAQGIINGNLISS